ncbi:unnamed protein product [Agarophyton chilense]
MSNRVSWNEMHEPDVHLPQSLGFFFCWHPVEFHDMSAEKRLPLYLSLSQEDEIQWAMYWRVSPLLLVATPSMVAYHSSQPMGDDNDRRSWLSWQVLFVEFGVMSLMAFLDTAKYVIRGNVCSEDWRVWYDENIPGPRGRLILLPDIMIRFLRNLGIQWTQFGVEETEPLLDHVLEVEWGKIPRILRYDWDTDSFKPIPRHPQGRDDARAYPAKPLRNQKSDISRLHVPDYYPKAISFDPLCFEPDVEATLFAPAGMSDGEVFGEYPFDLLVDCVNPPVESAVVLPTAYPPTAPPGPAPQDELSYGPPVAQVDIPPGEVTVEAESPVGDALVQTSTGGVDIAPSSPFPHFPASVTAAASDLRHVYRTVGITTMMDITTVLREACSWAPRSERYATVVQQGQDLKTAMVNLLQQNAQVMS